MYTKLILVVVIYWLPKNTVQQPTPERPICVPTGTCLPRKPGTVPIDVRVTLPADDGKCPNGKVLCEQNMSATKCGYTYAGNTIARDGPAPYGAYPWLAYITNQSAYIGSGVLLDRYHVLTAAHKIHAYRRSLQKLDIYIGVHNQKSLPTALKRTIEDVIIHSNFDPVTLKNDLAVLKLRAHIPLGYMKSVGIACLPKSKEKFTNQRCIVAGWGVTEFETFDGPSNYLKQVTVPIVSYERCERSMRNHLGPLTSSYLDKNGEICAGGEEGRDACTDDGGAPLICRDENGNKVVAGLVIWGKKCGLANTYGVYVDVAKYIVWIKKAIRNLQV